MTTFKGKDTSGNDFTVEIPNKTLVDIGAAIGRNTPAEKSDSGSGTFGGDRNVYDRSGGYGYQGIEDFKGTVVPGITAVKEAMKALNLKGGVIEGLSSEEAIQYVGDNLGYKKGSWKR